tara:strand:- start:37188 stop:39572 length:2385 start_codon:yes stop_codon:yes gene_type:complete
MRSWMIAFSLGIFLGGLSPSLPASHYYPLLLIPALLACLRPAQFSQGLQGLFSKLRLLSAFCLGLLWFLYWADSNLNLLLPKALERQDIWLKGTIVSLPEIDTNNIRFDFKVAQTCSQAVFNECEFSGNLLARQVVQLRLYESVDIRPGQQWQFKVRLKRPHGFLNPGGFDYEAWLWQKGIRATGYVRSDEENRLLETSSNTLFLNLRYQFLQTLSRLFPKQSLPYSGLILALGIGDRRGISDQQWQLFSATGTNHLMVISGMHVGFVALLIFQLVQFIIKRVTWLILYIPAQRLAALLALGAAYFYAAMAGFALPAQRAFIMIAAFMLGQCCCRHTNASNSYCLALALVLLINPLAPVSSGFWLSFVAVAVLIFFVRTDYQQGRKGILNTMLLLLKTQVFVFLGLLPFMLWQFQQSSISAPLVNLLAIPYITLLVIPLCLLILFLSFFSDQAVLLLGYLVSRLFDLFIRALDYLNKLWPEALLALPALNVWLWWCLLATLTLCLFSLSARARLVYLLPAMLCLLPLLLSSSRELNFAEFELHILDVGQGLAVVLRTREHVLLYDLGPAYSNNFNAGEGVILPFLRANNIRQPDRIMVSHADNDHAGGLPALLNSFPQADYFASDLTQFPAATQASLCRSGQVWSWDGVDFEVLHPDREGYSRNNASCVLKVSNGSHSVLLTGDIEAGIERRLLNSGAGLDAEILLAPHHGSRTSSSPAFIQAISPEYVVFSSGYLNQFRHPHPDIVNLYTNSGTIALSTAETGSISWLLDPEGPLSEPALYRQEHKRFWRILR